MENELSQGSTSQNTNEIRILDADHHSVNCPICAEPVPADTINSHIDHHLNIKSTPKLNLTSLRAKKTSDFKKRSNQSDLITAPIFKKRRNSDLLLTPATPERATQSTSAAVSSIPLAERVRPKNIEEFMGQPHLQRNQTGLTVTANLVASGSSFILWGPPGSGKTTLARCLANCLPSGCHFRELSGTEFGSNDWKKLVNEAIGSQKLINRKTLVFIDEAQRLNKAQQDLFLPYIESGRLMMILATTENPSFRLTAPLLSRCRLITLNAHRSDDILAILQRAIEIEKAKVDPELINWLSEAAEGDARVALKNLELIIETTKGDPNLGIEDLKNILGKKFLLYDKDGDNHYDLISALHKSVRGSDANAGLYWLARMLESGEDPLYVARRLIRMASEDIGLANPTALSQAVNAYQATQLLGMPECDCILAQVVVMLAESPKSVRVYKAYKRAKVTATTSPAYPVPLHLRNAPTRMMKDLGFGLEYKYEPDYAHPIYQEFLPTELMSQSNFLKDDVQIGEIDPEKIFDIELLKQWQIKKNNGLPWSDSLIGSNQLSKS